MSLIRERPLLTPPQAAAVEADGGVFVDAGAGSGKTTVLVERYVRAVTVRNHQPSHVLAVTFTRRAAGELQQRIRARLRAEGRAELIPLVEGGWIGTIHGACQRILAEFADQAGVAPGLRVADDVETVLLRDAAFDRALATVLHELGDDGLRLVSAYGQERLRQLATTLLVGARVRGHAVAAPTGDATPGELAALLEELRVRAADVAVAGGDGPQVVKRRQTAADLLDLLAREPDAFDLGDLEEYKRGDAAYKELIGEVEFAARDVLAAEVHPSLQALLDRYAAEYERGKAEAGAVDNEDLQVKVRDLLERDVDVRAVLQERFREILVDEFQDTDSLQYRVLELLRAPTTPLLAVGDEQQAIYGFRGAEVEVFRGERERAGREASVTVVELHENRRSVPPVLDAINAVFAREDRFAHQPLRPVREHAGDADAAVVELLIGAGENIGAGREIEASLVARRLRELVEAGECRPGQIAIVFRAGTNAGAFEAALRAEGLPTVSSTGRGFLDRQPVADLIAMLRVLWNRFDDHALLTCLASPMAGVSNDGLALMRQAVEWEFAVALDDLGGVGLRDDDLARAVALRDAIARLRPLAARLGLADLVAAIVAETRYDLAMLVEPDGAERMANIEKLRRVAQAYENARGADLPGFVTAVESGRLDGELKIEGVTASEDDDAVRLMTVHQAKGLEFPVVVVADTGGRPKASSPDALVPAEGAPAAIVPVATGRRSPTRALDAATAAVREADEREGHRIAYVACTRAEDRLIISGARGPSVESGSVLAWLLGLLDADAELGERVLEVDDARIGVLVADASVAPVAAEEEPDVAREFVLDEGEPQLTFDIEAVGAAEPTSDHGLPALAPLAAGTAWDPPMLSYSALEQFEACAYRFHVQRLLGLPAEQAGGSAAIGKAVHAAIEIGEEVDAGVLLAEEAPDASLADQQAARDALGCWLGSPLHARFAALPDVRHEQPFLLRLGAATATGFFDLSAVDGTRLVIGDVKVAELKGRTPEERRDDGYLIQESLYALAGLEAGHPEVEVAYQWVGDDEAAAAMASRVFTQADRERLRSELVALAERAVHGPWRPTPPAHGCGDCPALNVLCAGPALGER
ncbi:MAG: UvrD-helicase domain-containing protein [Gaiellales bacterium]